MVSSNDLRRLLNGVSLVALELAKRSPRGPDSVASSSLKTAVGAAADVVGITRGKVQAYSATKRRRRAESVVYFPETSKEAYLVTDVVPAHPDSANTPAEGSAATREEKEAVVGVNGVRVAVEGSDSGAEKVNEGESKRLVDGEEAVGEDNSGKVGKAATIKRKLRERRVPSTPLSRAIGFAGLGAGLAWGTLQESARRLAFGSSTGEDGQSALSPFLSESNAERLALALCRMRGAALKIGQMLSIQDEALIPAPILSALEIVRQGADVMPRSQLNRVLDDELGNDWTSKLQSFDYEPLAAASIGQVHKAVTRDGKEVAVKIQYPGVADSIDSDIENVRRLLNYTNLIPEGLYLDRAIKVAKDELSRECNYEMEAANQRRFRELLQGEDGFYVPKVIDNLCSRRVLTTELVSGIPIDAVASLDQPTRNYVGQKLLEITLKELFIFRFMQTDPNWGNFLYDEPKKIVNLIDFGAARDYPKEFVDNYLRMVLACANSDRDAILEMSRRLGFLTGEESQEMLEAHIQAALIVGLPFSLSGGYDFRSSNITRSVSNLGATMLKHRLTPPPDEAYSLHRKLSGAFLGCMKLGAVVPCREMLYQVYEQYEFVDDHCPKKVSDSSTS